MSGAPDELRQRDPAFALAIDFCHSLESIIDSYKVLLGMERERSARLEADIATLRARLSTRQSA